MATVPRDSHVTKTSRTCDLMTVDLKHMRQTSYQQESCISGYIGIQSKIVIDFME